LKRLVFDKDNIKQKEGRIAQNHL